MDCEPNRARLMCMLWLTFGFFVVEVVVSRLTSSLAMLSDSFHMLSDVIALVVALIAVRFAAKTQSTAKNTFGWIRAEVMGALVNAVFLTALCFTIVLEAIERFSEPREIHNALVVTGVGAAGLLVNLLGLCMFHGSGSAAGGGAAHGHSHSHSHSSSESGGHWLRKKKRAEAEKLSGNGTSVRDQEEINILVSGSAINGINPDKQDVFDLLRDNSMEGLQLNGISVLDDHRDEFGDVDDSASQLNMRGVFLHVLGDALGSVIVVVNALIFYFIWNPCPENGPCINKCLHDHCVDRDHLNGTQSNVSENSKNIPEAGPCWVLFLDPTLCCIMVCILLYTTYPLLKESALILLQTVPKQIDMELINEKLRNLEGVLAVHELHVWQLAGSRIIATAHIKCRDPTAYMDVAKRIKDFFHDEGIHATTIQPEFASVNSESRISLCELPCKTQCALKQCCGNGEKSSSDLKLETPSTHSLEVIRESPEHPNMRTPRNETCNNSAKSKDTQYESAV
ncbi:zinc transporter 1a [Hemiscyllium ocellatum]|uniref:zinc transporter 1a n=1 Tax=Hemiscyllium ocellatum TaxID=170820 RepID=UPI0029675A0D|nr:zinc transporter 1a [Hemiscyllium ocellatum]